MKGRSSGILLPIFSLPGAYGIGSLGGEAGVSSTFSPTPISTCGRFFPLFPRGAAIPLYVALRLCRKPLVSGSGGPCGAGAAYPEELSAARCPDPDHVDYAWLHATRLPLLRRAWTRDSDRASRTAFLESQSDWLPDTPSSARSMTISASLWISGRM